MIHPAVFLIEWKKADLAKLHCREKYGVWRSLGSCSGRFGTGAVVNYQDVALKEYNWYMSNVSSNT